MLKIYLTLNKESSKLSLKVLCLTLANFSCLAEVNTQAIVSSTETQNYLKPPNRQSVYKDPRYFKVTLLVVTCKVIQQTRKKNKIPKSAGEGGGGL